MDRRQLLTHGFAGLAGAYFAPRLDAAQAPGATALYLHPSKGADMNSGLKDAPLRTLTEAAKRVNASTASSAITLVLSEGVYALNETALFQPKRSFTRADRLTIRAEVLPDDPAWSQSRMPTLVHTMPLDPNWNGRPDAFGGVAYGLQIETSHVTVQGLKILGMPVIEHPAQGAIHRVYPIGRIDRTLDDLEIKQCLFAGDEVVLPNHCGILANGSGLVLDHCIFHSLKITVVYWTGGSTGHAMRNCLVYGAYGCGLWTSGIANDFDFRNNLFANSEYAWIAQGGSAARGEAGQAPAGDGGRGGRAAGAGRGAAPGAPAAPSVPVHYKLYDSLFAGNAHLTGTGGGPAINARPTESSFLEMLNTRVVDSKITLEMDQSKRNYLHAVAGSEEAKIGAGLFTQA